MVRDADPTSDFLVQFIGLSGSNSTTYPKSGHNNGLAPACNVSSDTYVKLVNGVYEIQYPKITRHLYAQGRWNPFEQQVLESNKFVKSRWQSAKVNCLGDSITAFGAKPYHSYFIDMLGVKLVRNYGLNDSCIAVDTTALSLLKRVPNMDNDADLITIMGGINDYRKDTPIGAITDTTAVTFYGGLNLLIEALISKYPDKTIAFIAPLSHVTTANGAGVYVKDYVAAVKNVCYKYSVPCLDLLSVCGIYPGSTAQKNLYLPDSLHPNDGGQFRIAKPICGFLQSI